MPAIKRKKLKPEKVRENLELLLIALPGIALIFVFSYLPMFGVVIAFKDFNPNLGILESPWVGFGNFEFFFTSQDAGRVLRNTVLYSITFLILDVAVGVILAILFYNLRSKAGLKIYNTILILPRFMSMVIIAFVVYALFSPTYGVVNTVLSAVGLDKVQWYKDPKYWPVILTLTHIWSTMGMNSVIYYASLVGLDSELLEAAELDGAGSLRKAWHIMAPHLSGVIIVLTILGIGSLFSGDFGLFYQVPKDMGMLYPSTDIINTYVFRSLISGGVEKSAAMGLFQSTASMILVLITNFIVRKISPEHSLF
jgi:putative aldouronate transport system permease protein